MIEYRIKLEEVLRSGKFGPLSLNDQRQDVHKWFGEPEGWGPPKSGKFGRPNVWKYGALQVAFDSYDHVSYFGIYPGYGNTFSSNLFIEGYFPEPETNYDAFKTYLEENQINYEVFTREFDDFPNLFIPPFVYISFYDYIRVGEIDKIMITHKF